MLLGKVAEMDDLTFMDLAVLERIDETTVVEKFGPVINSSFFDAANILGGVKTKGLIDFRSKFPGPSEVFVTEKGIQVMAMANEKSSTEIDELDRAVLGAIANGYKDETRIATKLNLRQMDLALHLNKLVKQNYLAYSFKSGRIEFKLTEAGFKEAGYPAQSEEEEFGAEEKRTAPMPKMAPVQQKPAQQAPKNESIDELMQSESNVDFGEAVPDDQPVKLDKEAMRNAKIEYYKGDIVKYAIVAVVLGLIGIVLLVWYLFFRG